MISDIMTTIQYYNYGVDAGSLKCYSTEYTNYQHLNKDATSSSHVPQSSSNNFVYFHCSLMIWAAIPIEKFISMLLGVNPLWNLLEEKLTCFCVTKHREPNMNLFSKTFLIILALPIIILICILDAFIFNPFLIIVSAIGNLDPRMDNISLIAKCKSEVKTTKLLEACLESFFQCALTMKFYSDHKKYFECPETLYPWVNKGTVFIISMIFSILSIILAIYNRVNEMFTLLYGKDWWKVWDRKDVLKEIWLLSLSFILFDSILIGFLFYIAF